jgi:glutamate racemase
MIGVYDSGFGGLTVLRALRARLPEPDYLYLGDSGRAPYGGRDVDTLLTFAEQCVERLFDEGCALVVVACHTVSCVALRHLQQRYIRDGSGDARRILGVTIPTAEAAVAGSSGPIAVLGTARTVASGTFAAEIHKLDPTRAVVQRAAPLWAPMVEEGLCDGPLARLAVRHSLDGLAECPTLVLGCTHYPLLASLIREEVGGASTVLDPSAAIADATARWLERHPSFGARVGTGGGLRIACTGDPAPFRTLGARFYGEPLPAVEHVAEEAGRLMPRAEPAAPRGQVVRAR